MLDRTASREAVRNRIFKALLRQIASQGDTEIRVSQIVMKALLLRLGFDWELLGDETHREIDAVALEALLRLALKGDAHGL